MELTVMSFNTQHCMNFHSRQIDYDAVASVIRESGADTIGLQEMRDAGVSADYEAQAAILGDKLGYYHYFAKAMDMDGKADPYGNAILSRFPILSAQTVILPYVRESGSPYPEDRALLIAEIAVEARPLWVYVTHLGVMPLEWEGGLSIIRPLLRDKRAVLMGDFNLTPENPLLVPLCETMQDTAAFFPAERLSFSSEMPYERIDYMFASRDLRILSADIPAVVCSDHRPYVVKMEI